MLRGRERERKRERKRERQTDRQTNRQTDRQTERHNRDEQTHEFTEYTDMKRPSYIQRMKIEKKECTDSKIKRDRRLRSVIPHQAKSKKIPRT